MNTKKCPKCNLDLVASKGLFGIAPAYHTDNIWHCHNWNCELNGIALNADDFSDMTAVLEIAKKYASSKYNTRVKAYYEKSNEIIKRLKLSWR